MSQRRIKLLKIILLAIALVIVGLGLWAFVIEPNRLVIHYERIVVSSPRADSRPLRIAAIGDIHAGSPFINRSKLKQLVELTNGQQPDLIVLLGDYMVRDKFYQKLIEPEITASVLKDLHAPLGVYAVLGNHDSWYDPERVKRAFEKEGITILDNDVRELRVSERSVWLIGLADAQTNRHDIRGTLARVPEGASIIVLEHHPDTFLELPPEVKLMLAAHTHGGQVNLPFLGRLIVPSSYGKRYAAGIIREGGKTMFVTTGVGTSILPVRFRVPPEIAILNVQGL
ncbi:MAG TPA: metallophosphoesterase [Pyrinomonadaceae bacterium]|nr:metallophosphoesterase [Pyrinomonadaceae bacterium]